MERESFEDQEVAAVLNRRFIAIKVDREERPDIDAAYMLVCQAMTGSGGWPLTILMTPDRKPFFAGTYFPKHRRYGQTGLIELLDRAASQWAENRQALLNAADEILNAATVQNFGEHAASAEASREPILIAVRQLKASFDSNYGGFGRAPKFPIPHNLMFLLRVHAADGGEEALRMAEGTLKGMLRGGIWDHIGFGFSRYSTDEKWLAPHFEKMLYDNALLVIALLECCLASGHTLYLTAAERTLQYIKREMTSPEGAFYSAQDADSEGVEGKYYTFTMEEIKAVLGTGQAAEFCKRYDITEKGNFEGVNILNQIGKPDAFDEPPGIEEMRGKLYAYRDGRAKLHKDDKVLTAWNALMIVACARSYRATGNNSYLDMAVRACDFIHANLCDESGLRTSWRDGKLSGVGVLDDYAFLLWACIELYEATFDARYLARAVEWADETMRRFADPNGGCYLSPAGDTAIPFRPKETYDGALPSGNSVFAYALVKLDMLTGHEKWRLEADRQIAFLLPAMERMPQGHTFALMALMGRVYPVRELICVVRSEEKKRETALRLGKLYHHELTALVRVPDGSDSLDNIRPELAAYKLPQGRDIAFYLCRNRSCAAPVYSWEKLLAMLRQPG